MPNPSEEIEEQLKHISELCKELRARMLDVMMPTTLEQAPGFLDIEARLVNFFNGEINLLLYGAAVRVQEHWPEQIAEPYTVQQAIKPDENPGMEQAIKQLDEILDPNLN